MKGRIALGAAVVAFAGLVFLLAKPNTFEISRFSGNSAETENSELPSTPEDDAHKDATATEQVNGNGDIGPQERLQNPPGVIKAIYATSWSASSDKKMGELISLINETELNAVVIDVKDFSGYIAYDSDLGDVEKYGAEEVRIRKLNTLIKRLHDNGIYVIARVTIFQDPVLAGARPDLAVMDARTGTAWKDRKGLSWMDPASKEVWDYNISIIKEVSGRGFDEINLDYIRFPSDGSLSAMRFPVYDETSMLKKDIIRDFFTYLRANTEGIVISADLFGLATVQQDDLGIGQIIEDAYINFDAVAPMTYPSHYAAGFLGYKNPANYPYEVISYSMERASARRAAMKAQGSPHLAKMRPWLQDFDLGADYTSAMIRQEIKAVSDTISGEEFGGWMLWDPRNNYTRGAINSE